MRPDLKDAKFENLVVIRRLEEKLYNEEAWLCLCDCGEETKATRGQLLRGVKKSCGCLRKKSPTNVLDLRDQKFGLLTAIERAGRTKKDTALWRCKCDCGNDNVLANATNLRRQEITSCGCQRSAQINNARNILTNDKSVDGVQIPLLTKKVRSDSGTGHKGVYKRTRKGKEYYEANITVKGIRRCSGPYKDLADAIDARKRLEEEYHAPYIKELEEKENGQRTD